MLKRLLLKKMFAQKVLIRKGVSTYVGISGFAYAGMQIQDSFQEVDRDPGVSIRDNWRQHRFNLFEPKDQEICFRSYIDAKEAAEPGLHKNIGINLLKSFLWPWLAFDFVKERIVLSSFAYFKKTYTD